MDDHTFDPTRYCKADSKVFLFETRVEAWYRSKQAEVDKGNLSPRYIDNFYLPFFKDMDVRDIKTFHIQGFYEWLPSDRSLKYLKNVIDALENLFNTLIMLDYISQKPSFPSIVLDRKAPRWVDRSSQLNILQAIPEKDRPIFTFLAFQGIGPGEARALKVKDLDPESGVMLISGTFSGSSNILRERVKGKVVRPRAMNPILIPVLKEQVRNKHPEAWVFTNPRTGTFYSESAIKRIWQKVKEKLD